MAEEKNIVDIEQKVNSIIQNTIKRELSNNNSSIIDQSDLKISELCGVNMNDKLEIYDSDDEKTNKLVTFNPECDNKNNVNLIKIIKNFRSKVLEIYLSSLSFSDNLEMEVIEGKSNQDEILNKTNLTINAMQDIISDTFKSLEQSVNNIQNSSNVNLVSNNNFCICKCDKCRNNKNEKTNQSDQINNDDEKDLIIKDLYNKNKLLQSKLIKYKSLVDNITN